MPNVILKDLPRKWDSVKVVGTQQCWDLRGSNRQMCTIQFEDPRSKQIRTGIASFSASESSPEISAPFQFENCDPTKEICDVPYRVKKPVPKK